MYGPRIPHGPIFVASILTMKVSLLLCCLTLVAHTTITTASCPFTGGLGDLGGYKEDIFALKLVDSNANTRTLPSVSWGGKSSCNVMGFKAVATTILSSLEAKTNGASGLEAPRAARAAFHAAATYRPAGGATALGGPNGGWLRFSKEVGFPENTGIDEVVEVLQDMMQQHPCITFADLITFAGVIAIEFAGGPAIAWMPGRRDALHPSPTLPVATSLPDGAFNAAGVMYWGTNLGLSAREMVVFVGGGHTFGAANFKNSGWNGSFTTDKDMWPTGPKNRWFIDLVTLDWQPEHVPYSNRLQFIPKGASHLIGENGGPIIRFPSDIAMLQAGGPLAHWIHVYSQAERLFLQDYAQVFQRIMQLGAGPGEVWSLDPKQYTWLGINDTAINYGTKIMPLNSSYDEDVVPSKLASPTESLPQASSATSVLTSMENIPLAVWMVVVVSAVL